MASQAAPPTPSAADHIKNRARGARFDPGGRRDPVRVDLAGNLRGGPTSGGASYSPPESSGGCGCGRGKSRGDGTTPGPIPPGRVRTCCRNCAEKDLCMQWLAGNQTDPRTMLGVPWTPAPGATAGPLPTSSYRPGPDPWAPRPTAAQGTGYILDKVKIGNLTAHPAALPFIQAYPSLWYPPGSHVLPTAYTAAQAQANKNIVSGLPPAGSLLVCWYQKLETTGGTGAGEQGKFLLICETPSGGAAAASIKKRCWQSVPDHPPIEITCFEDL